MVHPRFIIAMDSYDDVAKKIDVLRHNINMRESSISEEPFTHIIVSREATGIYRHVVLIYVGFGYIFSCWMPFEAWPRVVE